jgi:ketosteroid isomerase-like protein
MVNAQLDERGSMASMNRVEPARRVIDSFAARDAGALAAEFTDDVIVRPSAFISGIGEYFGRDDVRLGALEVFNEMRASGEDIKILDLAYYLDDEDDDAVLVLARITVRRRNGQEYSTDISYLFTFRGDKIAELNAWLDHAEGLSRLGTPRLVS